MVSLVVHSKCTFTRASFVAQNAVVAFMLYVLCLYVCRHVASHYRRIITFVTRPQVGSLSRQSCDLCQFGHLWVNQLSKSEGKIKFCNIVGQTRYKIWNVKSLFYSNLYSQIVLKQIILTCHGYFTRWDNKFKESHYK